MSKKDETEIEVRLKFKLDDKALRAMRWDMSPRKTKPSKLRPLTVKQARAELERVARCSVETAVDTWLLEYDFALECGN